jgi:tRNA modification GTPase
MASSDTIFALSSGALPSGVAVIRISGPAAGTLLARLCGSLPKERKAALRTISGVDGEVLDQGLVLYFKGPASFTGEDCAEVQVHGGRAVVAAILEFLSQLPGTRHAEAGEFARRAFENGKMDLVEAEGLADLIQAETAAQRRLARYLADGHLSRRYQQWMGTLSRCRALIEAELDFADEGDVPGSVSEQVWKDVDLLGAEMRRALSDHVSELVHEGFRVAIAGPPNVGKSSLLNWIAKRDVSIVTDIAGTTRDVLSVDVDLGGMKVVFFDTAGLRDTEDPVERIGIERARGAMASADLVVFLRDASRAMDTGLDVDALDAEKVMLVWSKTDLAQPPGPEQNGISTQTGFGVDSLLKQIEAKATGAIQAGTFLTPLLSRHRNHVASALDHIHSALSQEGAVLELRAESLRLASEDLGRLTGRVSADQLLGLVFSQFCIGK